MHLKVLVLWTLLLSLSITSQVFGRSAVAGQSFVVGLPLNKTSSCDIYFLMFTLAHDTITVDVTSQWLFNQQFNGVVSLSRDQPAVYHLLEKKNMKLSSRTFHHTYALTSSSNFSLTVVVVIAQVSMESIQAVPVEGWGKRYFAVLAMLYSIVQVVTASENKVTLSVHANETISLYIHHHNTDIKYVSIIHLSLALYESFSFGNCLDNQLIGLSRGVEVIGKNSIGVIISTCTGHVGNTTCDKTLNDPPATSGHTEFLAEMLLPEATSGKEFVLMNLSMAGSYGYFLVVAAKEMVKVAVQHRVLEKHSISHAGQMLRLKAIEGIGFVKSNRAVQVIYIQSTNCNGRRHVVGLNALSLVVPNGLFLDAYFWITKDVGDFKLHHYLVYICKDQDFPELQLDLNGLSTIILRQLAAVKFGSTNWQQGVIKLNVGEHYFYGRLGSKFGAYLYGFQGTLSYMHAAGFISSPITGMCMSTLRTMISGDLLDNDCDGQVDEERNDRKDNDLDGRIDEDLMPNPTVDGGWGQWNEWYCIHCVRNTVMRNRLCNSPRPQNIGRYCYGSGYDEMNGNCFKLCNTEDSNMTEYFEENEGEQVSPASGMWSGWTEWECTRNCDDRFLLRTRKCDSPPPDPGGDQCPGTSYQYADRRCTLICPGDCPEKTWGKNCSKSCEFCREDCDKLTGVCRLCESGYRFPQLHCSVACGKYTFGPNCQGNCFKKCDGLDCLDRILGLCPPEQRKFLWLLLLFLLPLPVLFFYYVRGRADKKDEDFKEAVHEKLSDLIRARSLMRSAVETSTSLTSLSRMAGIYYFAPEESEI